MPDEETEQATVRFGRGYLPIDYSQLELRVLAEQGITIDSLTNVSFSAVYGRPLGKLEDEFPTDAYLARLMDEAWNKIRRRMKLRLRKTWYEWINQTRVD